MNEMAFGLWALEKADVLEIEEDAELVGADVEVPEEIEEKLRKRPAEDEELEE